MFEFRMVLWSVLTIVPAAAFGQVTEEEIRFAGAGVTLAGTLMLPAGDGPHGAIVLTHGSEPADHTAAGYRSLARGFAENGVAAFIYSKRGVGGSEGAYVEAPDLRVPAADLLGAITHLRGHPEIDGEHIGVWGASQGGWVGPIAAAMSDAVAFLCIVSAPGVSPLEQNLYDKGNQLRAKGVADEDVARATAFRRAFWTYLVTGEGYDEATRAHADIEGEPWFTRDDFPIPLAPRTALLRDERLHHFALHYAYEPRLTLERVRVPTLVIFGGDDTVVPVERSAAAFREAFAFSGHENLLRVEVFPGGDHGVRVLRTDGQREFASGYRELMVEWVRATASRE